MWEDEEEFEGINFGENDGSELHLSSNELCQFVKTTLEEKHGVSIVGITYEMGYFTFSVLTSDVGDMPIPFRWSPVSFGYGTVTFRISFEEFQYHYHKIEGRDFIASVKVVMKRLFGSVCDIVSVKTTNKPIINEGAEVIVKVKEGCTLSFRDKPWLPMVWATGDKIAFEIDEETLNHMLNS